MPHRPCHPSPMDIYERLKAARILANLSQTELAERIGVSQPMIARLESKLHEPKLSTIQRIADATGAVIVLEFRPRR